MNFFVQFLKVEFLDPPVPHCQTYVSQRLRPRIQNLASPRSLPLLAPVTVKRVFLTPSRRESASSSPSRTAAKLMKGLKTDARPRVSFRCWN